MSPPASTTAARRLIMIPVVVTLGVSLLSISPGHASQEEIRVHGETPVEQKTGSSATQESARQDSLAASTSPPSPGARVAGLPVWTPPAQFQVDMVCTYGDQTITLERHIDGARIRTDMESDGQKVSMIELGDADGTTLMIMPDRKQVMRQSQKAMMEASPKAREALEKRNPRPTPAGEAPTSTMVYLGREKVDGKDADKYQFESGGQKATAWIDPTTRYPLQMESKDAVVRWKNYRVEEQPQELFEAPRGYAVTDLDEMMKQMKAIAGGAGLQGMAGMAGLDGVSGIANSMAGHFGGQLAAGFGGSLGASLGGALGGPIGAMAGQYLGGKLGALIGSKTAKAVVPGH